MSVYNINGEAIDSGFDVNGEMLNDIYDIDGSIIGQSREILFEDDFDGASLDLTKWTYELGYGRNNELQQFYANCVSIEDGCCVLTATKLDNTSTPYQSWKSGSITTQDKFTQRYGRFEARIKFPNITGAFPAFWMVGSSLHYIWQEGEHYISDGIGHWPGCGEVDIVEIMPGSAKTAASNVMNSDQSQVVVDGLGRQLSGEYNPATWHIYACEWTDTYMEMALDGVVYARYVWADYPPVKVNAYTGAEQMWMWLNLSVGAAGGTPSAYTEEMKMYIDWVRVYAPLQS